MFGILPSASLLMDRSGIGGDAMSPASEIRTALPQEQHFDVP